MAEVDLKSLVHDYNREVFDETKGKLQDGEYIPGKIYAQQFPDDIADAIENILFLQDFTEITVRVRKSVDEYHVDFEVTSKK